MDHCKLIYNMELRDDDLWLVTLPKTGTTWMSHVINSIYNRGPVKDAPFYFLEYEGFAGPKKETSPPDRSLSYTECLTASSPRHIKSHLPITILPKNILEKSKMIYVARNPMDACVSFYHHMSSSSGSKGNKSGCQGGFQSFFKLFIDDHVPFGPFWTHFKEAWDLRNHPNFLLIFYEDMKSDFPASIKKVAEFLNVSLTDDEVESIADGLTIDKMKANTTSNIVKNVLLRKGIVGDWKEHFTDKMVEEMKAYNEKWIKDLDVSLPNGWEI